MRIDAHIHMMTDGSQTDRSDFLDRLHQGGMDAGVIFSPAPGRMFGGSAADYRERVECVLRFTRDESNLFPFYFLDPTDKDAAQQVEYALSCGIMGFKIICNHFYPGDERAMDTYRCIAEKGAPLMFHSGILYDGINVSGKYNRPCEFEPLLSVSGLRFSMAHVSWPWTDECIAVFGKFSSYLERNPDGKAADMHLDLTPGTPFTYREGMLTHLLENEFPAKGVIFWGSDNSIENYRPSYVQKWVETDTVIYKKLGLTQEEIDCVYGQNFLRFLHG